MAYTLEQMLKDRPGNKARQDAEMKRMIAEVNAYRLRELREALELTQTEVAQALDISQKRVSEIERGEVDRTKVDTLRRYAVAIGGTLRVEVEVGDEVYRIA